MKVLTVCQPHAWAVVSGPKRFENRAWQTAFRGPLLIHAGKSREWLEDFAQYPNQPRNLLLTFGAVVGVAELVAIRRVADTPRVPCASGPYCWELRRRHAFANPVRWPGERGLWMAPPELLERLRAEIWDWAYTAEARP